MTLLFRQQKRLPLCSRCAPWCSVWFFLLAGVVAAEEPAPLPQPPLSQRPLHQKIDQMMARAYGPARAPVADDAEFLRRVFLDLTDNPPSPEETRAFLNNTAADKRAKLIDRLLASPEFTRHFSSLLDIMLMERRPAKHVSQDAWRKYLYDSVAANKPFHQLASEILGADGVDEKMRPAANFYFARDVEPNLLTRDVGRIFFGRDMQCAQCHDHPLINSYYQADYHGLLAFLTRSYLFTAKDKKKTAYVAEKAEGEAPFQSVFDKNTKGVARPRMPGGEDLGEPTFAKGEEYVVKPEKNKRPQPKYSRRLELAKQIAKADNRAFNVNVSNRLWASMMGRGLVHPLDLHHDDNPSVHPQLTELLAREIVAFKFDVRAFLREIALSQTYQRGLLTDDILKAAPTAEQIAAWMSERKAAAGAVEKLSDEVEALATRLTAARQKTPALTTAFDAATKNRAAAIQAQTKNRQEQATSAAALKTAGQTLALLETTASKAAAVVAQLPEEKEVAAAAKLFAARVVQWKEKVVAANADFAAKQKNEQAATALVVQTEQAFKAAEAARQAQLQAVAALAAEHQALAARGAETRRALATAVQSVKEAQRHVEIAQLKTAAENSHAAAATAERNLAAAQQRLAKLAADLPAQDALVKKTTAEHQAAAAGLVDKEAQAAQAMKSLQLLTDLAAAADAARQQLKDDAELVASAAQLQQRRAAQEKQHAALQALLKTQRVTRLAAALDASQKTFQKSKAEQASLSGGMETQIAQAKLLRTQAAAAQTALTPKLDALREAWTRRFLPNNSPGAR